MARLVSLFALAFLIGPGMTPAFARGGARGSRAAGLSANPAPVSAPGRSSIANHGRTSIGAEESALLRRPQAIEMPSLEAAPELLMDAAGVKAAPPAAPPISKEDLEDALFFDGAPRKFRTHFGYYLNEIALDRLKVQSVEKAYSNPGQRHLGRVTLAAAERREIMLTLAESRRAPVKVETVLSFWRDAYYRDSGAYQRYPAVITGASLARSRELRDGAERLAGALRQAVRRPSTPSRVERRDGKRDVVYRMVGALEDALRYARQSVMERGERRLSRSAWLRGLSWLYKTNGRWDWSRLDGLPTIEKEDLPSRLTRARESLNRFGPAVVFIRRIEYGGRVAYAITVDAAMSRGGVVTAVYDASGREL